MRARQGARMIAAVILLAGCASTPTDTQASSTPVSTALAGPGTSTSPARTTSLATSSPGPASPVTPAAAGAPICTAESLAQAANAGRSADSQLTVTDTDVQCQDAWAVVGANDLVNKAQYTFVFQWSGEQWQRIPDRSAACASQQIPDQLHELACRSN